MSPCGRTWLQFEPGGLPCASIFEVAVHSPGSAQPAQSIVVRFKLIGRKQILAIQNTDVSSAHLL